MTIYIYIYKHVERERERDVVHIYRYGRCGRGRHCRGGDDGVGRAAHDGPPPQRCS